MTVTTGPGITAEELRDVCIRAVEEWQGLGRIDWKARAEKAEAELSKRSDQDAERALLGATPPADLDGYVRAYMAAYADGDHDGHGRGIAAVLAARDAWWRERLESDGAVEAAGTGLGYMRVGAGISLTDAVTDVRSALRAAIAHVLESDGEAPKPEPAAPAPPPLPEVPRNVRRYGESWPSTVEGYIVALDAALRAERGGR